MSNATDMTKMDMMILRMEIENLKSFVDLKAQYIKELGDAVNGTGLCSGISIGRRRSIINDLNEHIKGTDEAIKTSRDRIAEISNRLNSKKDI